MMTRKIEVEVGGQKHFSGRYILFFIFVLVVYTMSPHRWKGIGWFVSPLLRVGTLGERGEDDFRVLSVGPVSRRGQK